MAKKINIIGAGVAGLCAGSYLQMNGYDTEIFEMHNLPGGLCTAWDRGGYRFDGCIHWLMGASPANAMYNFWNELVDMKKMEMVFSDEFFVLENTEGEKITVFRNVDKLESEMLRVAPEDKQEIHHFIKAVRKFTKLDYVTDKAPETMNLIDLFGMMFKLLPYMPQLMKWKKFTLDQYSQRFKNPLLREAIRNGFVPEMAAIFFIISLADMHRKGSGYPMGGSLNFARQLEKRYLQLGGKIHYDSKVKKILVSQTNSGASAFGVELENGQTYPADITISAADGYDTIFRILDGKFLDSKTKNYYEHGQIFSSYLQVSFGINRTFENDPSSVYLFLKQPIVIDPETSTDSVGFRIFNFDPTLAPTGKTTIVAMLGTHNYQHWINLRKNDPATYKAEKRRIANELIAAMENRFGNIKEKVEVIDVSTPATVVRYTNNWKGSFEGWVMTPKNAFTLMKNSLPGLSNFYMIGQWVSPGGGLPSGLLTGRNITQVICKNDRKKFATMRF